MIFSSKRESGGSHQIQGSPFGDLIPSWLVASPSFLVQTKKTYHEISFDAYSTLLQKQSERMARFASFSWFSFDSKNSDRTPIWKVRMVRSLAEPFNLGDECTRRPLGFHGGTRCNQPGSSGGGRCRLRCSGLRDRHPTALRDPLASAGRAAPSGASRRSRRG